MFTHHYNPANIHMVSSSFLSKFLLHFFQETFTGIEDQHFHLSSNLFFRFCLQGEAGCSLNTHPNHSVAPHEDERLTRPCSLKICSLKIWAINIHPDICPTSCCFMMSLDGNVVKNTEFMTSRICISNICKVFILINHLLTNLCLY